jgi:hypothetical protein
MINRKTLAKIVQSTIKQKERGSITQSQSDVEEQYN